MNTESDGIVKNKEKKDNNLIADVIKLCCDSWSVFYHLFLFSATPKYTKLHGLTVVNTLHVPEVSALRRHHIRDKIMPLLQTSVYPCP